MAFLFSYVNDERKYEGYRRADVLETSSERKLIQEFRLGKAQIQQLCEIVREDMKCVGGRSIDLSLTEKVLICLKTLGSGSFQSCSKDFMFVIQPTVSRVLSTFVDSMVKKASLYIFLPGQEEEIKQSFKDFETISGLPKVIGAIDGTHIEIIAPAEDEYANVNRKNSILSIV